MAEAMANKRAGARFRPSFHLWMALAMSAFVFGGFGMTYISPLATGTFPPAPPVVHLHGAVFFSWMALLIGQSLLVNIRNVRLHRSLGTFGIALAGWVVFTGILIMLVAASNTTLSGNGPGVFYLSVVAPPSFGILFAMAIRAVRTPEVHRNLILIATISILMPGINRVYMNGLGIDRVPFVETYMTMNVFLAAILLHERRTAGSISRATLIGAAIVVVPQLLLYPIASTRAWEQFVFFLGSLVYYR